MLESDFQADIIKFIKAKYPRSQCEILKNDSGYKQGFPDLLILVGTKWAVLEVKASEDAPYRPNQEWYLEKLRNMSFSATIYPENRDEVLKAMIEFFDMHHWV